MANRNKAAQSSKQHVESPVPLPHYAQALAHKRSAAYLSDTVETPGFKRRQIQHSINDTRHESPMSINPAPTSTSLVPTSFLSAARTVELDGRLVNVFGRTGNRKYNEYWLPCKSAFDKMTLNTDDVKHQMAKKCN